MNRYEFITTQNREAIVKLLKSTDLASLSRKIGIAPLTLKAFVGGMWNMEMKSMIKIDEFLLKELK